MQRTKSVSIVITERLHKQLEHLESLYGVRKAPELFRFAIAELCRRDEEMKLRYGSRVLSDEEKLKRTPKSVLLAQRQNAEIEKIWKMDIDQLNTYLAGKGYLAPDREAEGQAGTIIKERMLKSENGVIYHTLFYQDANGNVFYKEQIATLEEVINKLIKQKKI